MGRTQQWGGLAALAAARRQGQAFGCAGAAPKTAESSAANAAVPSRIQSPGPASAGR